MVHALPWEAGQDPAKSRGHRTQPHRSGWRVRVHPGQHPCRLGGKDKVPHGPLPGPPSFYPHNHLGRQAESSLMLRGASGGMRPPSQQEAEWGGGGLAEPQTRAITTEGSGPDPWHTGPGHTTSPPCRPRPRRECCCWCCCSMTITETTSLPSAFPRDASPREPCCSGSLRGSEKDGRAEARWALPPATFPGEQHPASLTKVRRTLLH